MDIVTNLNKPCSQKIRYRNLPVTILDKQTLKTIGFVLTALSYFIYLYHFLKHKLL